MKNWLRRLSNTSEFVIVIVVALAWPILLSTMALLVPGYVAQFSDASLCVGIAYELLVLSVIGCFLWVREWKLSAFHLELSPSSAIIGFALALTSYVCYAVAYMFIATLVPAIATAQGAEIEVGHLSLVAVLAFSIVNATFEEAVVVGYVFAALNRSRSTHFAMNLSIGLRVLYHLYQGPAGVVFIMIMGILFALYYARWKRLGPLIVAHALMDILGLWMIRG